MVARQRARAVGAARRRRHERDELLLEAVEQRGQLGRGQARLVVVEQHVVRVREVAGPVEARGVAVREIDHALERRPEEREVARVARVHPRLLGVRGGARHLGGQLRRNPHGLVMVAPDRGHEPRVVGVRVDGCRPRLQGVEQVAERGIGQPVVLDPLQRLELVGPRTGAAARHQRVLIPQEQAADAAKVGDLPGPLAQLGELLGRFAH
jgi:hypothetical protein